MHAYVLNTLKMLTTDDRLLSLVAFSSLLESISPEVKVIQTLLVENK